jgi:hypothetical protein
MNYTHTKGTRMSKSSDTTRSLPRHIGAAGPARSCVFQGTGARIAVLLTIVTAIAAFGASPAMAKEVHLYGSSFGSAGSDPGQLNDPAGVAVNDSTSLTNPVAGDVYVVDKGNNRVEYFNSTGEYKGQFSGVELEDPTWVAVDNDESSPSFGDVYVTDNGQHAVDKFSSTGTYLSQITTGKGGAAFSELQGVAVDLTGELWVYQSTHEVDNYSDALMNAFIASRNLNFLGFPVSPGFAMGPEGDLYASLLHVNNPSEPFFVRFNSLGEYAGEAENKSPWGYGSPAQIAAAVDLSNNELYIDYGTTVGAFDASDETQLESFGSGHMSASTGVAVNSSTGSVLSNDVYVSNGTADRVEVYDRSEVAETVTEAAVPVGKTEATLHGTVNPEGIEVTSCEFEYGTEAGVFSHAEPCSHLPGSGTAKVSVEAKLKDLPPSTAYHYRLTATNTNGIPGPSVNEEHFETLPAVDALSTGSAEEVTPNTAKLTGSLSPDGTDAHYYFQYGTSTNYGYVSPARPGTDAGEANAAVQAETNLTELTASTTYDFRLVGVNSFGTTYGENVEFKTSVAVEAVSTGPAEEVTGNTAKLTGSLSPDSTDAHYYFQYGTEAGIYGSTAPALPGVDAGAGQAVVHAETAVSGLTGDTVYHYRIVAVNAIGTTYGQEQTFTTEITPVIAAGVAKAVSASSWDLTATVNPEGLGLHSCKFEYGTSTAYEDSVNCEQTKRQIGDGTEPVSVSLALSELQANTEYHWRLVVSNAYGSSLGSEGSADHTFVYSIVGAELPDRRAYEMVTPPFKGGGLIGDVFFGFPPAVSEDGSRVMALTIQCFVPAESCNTSRGYNGEPYAFTRTPTGWVTTALAPSSARFSENSPWLVSADEDTALFSMPTGPAGEDVWYSRSSDGSFSPIGPVTSPGQEIGVNSLKGGTVIDATGDFSHVLWDPEKSLDEDPEKSLDEYVGVNNPQPFLVGVSGERSSTELISGCGTILGSAEDQGHPWNALSADGRTVYFTAKKCLRGTGVANQHMAVPADELYARVDGEELNAHTVAISQPEAPETLSTAPADKSCTSEECQKDISETANWRGAEFEGASVDGSMAFFLDPQQLTDKATEGTGEANNKGCTNAGTSCNLYLYDFDQPEGHDLIDVSTPEISGESPQVLGVLAISGDGSHIYFVANGVLASGATPGNCISEGASGGAGRCDLYVYERDAQYPDGHIAFIESLPGAEIQQWQGPEFSKRANVTPDGRFLVFEDGGQIFRYDAETGALVRISVGSDGFDDNGDAGVGVAKIAPAFQSTDHAGPARGDPTMSDDGSYVFFDSPRGLTPNALNDVPTGGNRSAGEGVIYAQNVYEWHEGQVYLISDGHDTNTAEIPACGEQSAVCLLGTDATGHDVFFTTADRLVPSDTDTQIDIYDARVCEPESGNPCVAEPPVPLPPCLGEACHGIPAATPSLLAPGTASFNGEGNVTPAAAAPPPPKNVTKKAVKCKKGFVKKKARCVKKRKVKGGNRAKKASRDRRSK